MRGDPLSVQAQDRKKGGAFRPMGQAFRIAGRNEGEKLLQTARGKLVQIGMPRGDQGYAQCVSEIGAELSEFAGTGDVDDVGAKVSKSATHLLLVAPEEQVVAQVAFDAKAGPTARQFQPRDTAVLESSEARPSEHGQKRARTAFGEIHEVARCKGDAVDFVKGLAKQSNTRLRTHKPPSSLPRKARRTAGRTCGLTRNAMTQRNLSTTC
jgi:hypothetical protein